MRATLAGAALLLLAAQARANPPPAVAEPEVTSQMLVAKLRGIRAAAPSVGPKPAGQVEAAIKPSVDLSVPFRTGSAELDGGALRIVTALGTALTDPALKGNHFLIEGHTDTVGTPAANQTLSDTRARAVAAYLIAHFDIAPQLLTAKGVGQNDLAVPTADQVDEPRNRRVKVVNLGPG